MRWDRGRGAMMGSARCARIEIGRMMAGAMAHRIAAMGRARKWESIAGTR